MGLYQKNPQNSKKAEISIFSNFSSFLIYIEIFSIQSIN